MVTLTKIIKCPECNGTRFAVTFVQDVIMDTNRINSQGEFHYIFSYRKLEGKEPYLCLHCECRYTYQDLIEVNR